MDDSITTNSALQPAYILHSKVWQESSLIVDALTLNHGRIVLMAKGARTSRSQVRALYEPFRPLLLSWIGKSELKTLTGIEESGPSMSLSDTNLACAYYINEIVLRLTGKEQVQQALFAHYAWTISGLAASTMDMNTLLRTFELQLLEALGILPNFLQCTIEGAAIDPHESYRYYPSHAIAVPVNNQSLLQNKPEQDLSFQIDGITKEAGIEVSGETLHALATQTFDTDLVKEQSRRIMREILALHLGDRPLKSRELFASLASLKK